jgi:4-hydroxy-2-oxoheptanedioate aldolase
MTVTMPNMATSERRDPMFRSISFRFRAPRPTINLLVLIFLVAFAALPAVAQDRRSHVISVLEDQGVAIGTITSALAAPGTFEALRELPLDWVFIDMEHGPFDPTAVRSIIASFRAADGTFPVTPIVRIPANCSEVEFNQWMFKQVLDAGAFGVIVPHCDARRDVVNSVVAMRYPPLKGDLAPTPRGVRGAGGAPAAWELSFEEYVEEADLWPLDPQGELLFVPMIESRDAIHRLHAILDVPGVGATFIGPSDLHADMGYAGQSGVPEVEAQILQALQTAQNRGLAIGITTSIEDAQARIDEGFRFITLGAASPAELAEALQALGR